jgi:hypothetical protein
MKEEVKETVKELSDLLEMIDMFVYVPSASRLPNIHRDGKIQRNLISEMRNKLDKLAAVVNEKKKDDE